MNAQEALEATAERIESAGWKRGSQPYSQRGPGTPACVLDSLSYALFESNVGDTYFTAGTIVAMDEAEGALTLVLHKYHGWDDGIVAWNDNECDGWAAAADLCREAAKEIANGEPRHLG